MKNLLTKVFGKMQQVQHQRRSQAFRPRFETLEERALMSVGPEFHVNDFKVTLDQDTPAVASQSGPDGGSVVVWRDQFDSTGDTDIKAQRFDGAGNKIGGEITVASTSFRESDPAVAMQLNGNFVVTWTVQYSSTDTDVLAQRFFAD